MAYRRSQLMEERLADNRGRIVLATRRLIAEGGFREAQMAAVAAAAGLSTGAIYRYFPSKAELFVEVLTEAVRHEIVILNAIAAGPEDATTRLRLAVESFAQRALEGRHLAYAFIAEPVDPEVEAARLHSRRAFGDVFKAILRDGIAGGEFPDQDIDVGAACIVGAFTEALVRPVAPTAKAVADRQRLVSAISSFCVRAITGAATAARRRAPLRPRSARR
ncbi:MAG: TetR/AcrR family transcriptional regulator [Nevskia sp.]|nr:TetR/AcrR family transcriptional regulator [Nevskia sp.]